MEARTRAILPAVLLAAAALAGCLALTDDPAPAPTAEEDDEPGNDLLAGAAVSSGASTVSGGAEPELLVDPDGSYVLVGDTSGVYASTDGGESWTDTDPPFVNGVAKDGWSLSVDDTGTVYAANTNGNTVQLARTDDPTNGWEAVPGFADAAPIADRPWIAAEGDGRLAVLLYDFGRTFQEYCLQSADGGDTFTERSTDALGPLPNAGNAVFDASGDLYWAVEDRVYERKSTPGLLQPELCTNRAHDAQVLDGVGPQVFTRVAVDGERVVTAGPTSDGSSLQIAGFEEMTGQLTQLTLDPVLDGDALAQNTFVAVGAQDGDAAIAWYGTETDGDPTSGDFDGHWNVYTARVEDAWNLDTSDLTCEHAAVTCDRITETPNHHGGICMSGVTCTSDRDLLDYFDTEYGPDGALHVAYGDDYEGTADNGSSTGESVKYARLAPLSG